MKQKKVTIYYGGFKFVYGGVNSHIKLIESSLSELGFQVSLITLDSLPIFLKYLPHILEKMINFFIFPLGFFYKGKFTRFLYKFFFAYKCDYRIFEDVYLSWNSQTPSITILHAVWSDNLQVFSPTKFQINKLITKEENIINKINHTIATVSYPYRDFLINKHFSDNLLKEFQVIELGIDQKFFSPKISRNIKSLIYCGALEVRKNVFFLLELFKKLYDTDASYKLTIIGDGPERNKLISFKDKYNLPILFLGRLNHSELVKQLHQHEIYIHTSTKESFSYALLEAKLAGLKTFAYKKLQIPREFIDVPIEKFIVDEWCSKIHENKSLSIVFDKNKYTAKRMTTETIKLAK